MQELMRQLMGDPLWELRLGTAAADERLALLMNDLVEIEQIHAGVVRYRCPDAIHINPILLRRLAEQHLPVVALTEIPRSLEDVYLRIVDQHFAGAASASTAQPAATPAPPTAEQPVEEVVS
jgi:ABC-2 type transport system ATP-binding protein